MAEPLGSQNTKRCRTCGSPVRIIRQKAESRLGGPAGTVEIRKCTNLDCDNNTGNRRLGDAP